MADDTSWKKAKVTAVVTFWGFAAGTAAAVPQGTWSASWGNFFGAAIVAVGGVLGCLHHAKVASDRWVTLSWACIVIGGFVIAGASLQAALAPPS